MNVGRDKPLPDWFKTFLPVAVVVAIGVITIRVDVERLSIKVEALAEDVDEHEKQEWHAEAGRNLGSITSTLENHIGNYDRHESEADKRKRIQQENRDLVRRIDRLEKIVESQR